MEKLKVFFDKFKGIILTAALALITLIEMYGGIVGGLFGDFLIVNGVNLLGCASLIATAVVGILSNTFTKDQWLEIKEMIAKATGKSDAEQVKVLNKQVDALGRKYSAVLAEYDALEQSLGQETALSVLTQDQLKLMQQYNAQKAILDKKLSVFAKEEVVTE